MKLYAINTNRLGYSEPPIDDDFDVSRECAVDVRYSQIWDDDAELESVLDEAGFPFRIQSVTALVDLNRLLAKQPENKDDDVARLVRGILADIDRVVDAAAQAYVDNYDGGI